MQSTQGRRGKRKSALSSLERESAPLPLNLEAKLASGEGNPDGSFAIADLAGSRISTQKLPDGKISLTLKVPETKPSEEAKPESTQSRRQAPKLNKRKKQAKGDSKAHDI